MTSEVDIVIMVEPVLTWKTLPGSVNVSEDTAIGTRLFTVQACCSFTAVKVST
jgi:hypothetical protein